MKYCALFLVVVMLLGCGCSASMNVQRSSIRSAVDVVTTVRLDQVSIGQVDDERLSIQTVTEKILAFLEGDETDVIDFESLEAKISDQLDDKFKPFVEQMFARLSKYVRADTISPFNRKRGIAFCRGAILACTRYDKTDRDDD